MFNLKNKKIIFYVLSLFLLGEFFILGIINQARAEDITGCCKFQDESGEVFGCEDGKKIKDCGNGGTEKVAGFIVEFAPSQVCAKDDRCIVKSETTILQIPLLGTREVADYGTYINLIYKWMIGIASILAVLTIMIAGFQWILAAGNSGKIGKAKDKIKNSLIAIGILALSYLILLTINPKLVELKMPGVTKIRPIALNMQNSTANKLCVSDKSIPCGEVSVQKNSDGSYGDACMGFQCSTGNVWQGIRQVTGNAKESGRVCQVTLENGKYKKGSCVQELWTIDEDGGENVGLEVGPNSISTAVGTSVRAISPKAYTCGGVWEEILPGVKIGVMMMGAYCAGTGDQCINVKINGRDSILDRTRLNEVENTFCSDDKRADAVVYSDVIVSNNSAGYQTKFACYSLKSSCENDKITDSNGKITQSICSPFNGLNSEGKNMACRLSEDEKKCEYREFLDCSEVQKDAATNFIQVPCSTNSACGYAGSKCVDADIPAGRGRDTICCVVRSKYDEMIEKGLPLNLITSEYFVLHK